MKIEKITRDECNGEVFGVVVHTDTDLVRAKYEHVVRTTPVDCWGCVVDHSMGLTYVGEGISGFEVIETNGRFEIMLVEEGFAVRLRPREIEDGEVLDLDRDWIELLPVIRWFMGIWG